MQFRYDIQGLRAIAVLLVFIFHLNSGYLSGGFVGVDIFFVISGYLVSGIILYKIKHSTFNFIDFYVGRIKRLIPVYAFFLLFVITTGTLVYLNIDMNSLRMNLFWSSIFGSNQYLATQDNYFGAKSSENPFLHTWTLSIEMQFYLLLPIYLYIVKKEYLFKLTLFIIIMLTMYSYYNIHFLGNKQIIYFSLIARIPEFLIGLIFGMKETKINNFFSEKIKSFITIVSLILILISSVVYSENSEFPGLMMLVPCLATGFLLIFKDGFLNAKILTNKILVHIGQISYSIYLWHWAIMAFIRYYNSEYQFNIKETIFIIILTYVLSLTSYKFIEEKYKNLSKRNLFINSCILGILLFVLFKYSNPVNEKLYNLSDNITKPTFGIKSHAETFTGLEFFGDIDKANDSILLIGDSHALVYKGILDEIGKNKRFNFLTVTNNVYPNIPGINRKDFKSNSSYANYLELTEKAENAIKKSKFIIISSVWSDTISSLPEAFKYFVNKVPKEKKIIILSDFPILDKNPVKVNRGIIRDNNKDNDYSIKINSLPHYITKLLKENNNVYLLHIKYEDVIKDIPFNNDTIMYYDAGHLNYYGSKVVASEIKDDFYKKLKTIVYE
ncbi:acyltransferase family protein [Chryseobacterium sp. JAH]|uniref:acyltransferase family protein n=1 Tax=Chryseobacterium sp. JAH TaxID=1742858 RepID=UPI000740C95B|nr:acyltransferase family protein [Chryseobacterium sp. JAH]KUJ50593.1 hypothetical protein AR685_14970 [Chryseobacterium sp. JAH]